MILIPLVVYCFIIARSKNYKVNIAVSHILIHLIMWCTMWATYYLPNKQYVCAGTLIMMMCTLVLGFASSFKLATASQLLIVVNIFVSHLFNQYDDLPLILSFGLPCTVGCIFVHYKLTESYYEMYVNKVTLENLSYYDQLTGVYNRHIMTQIATSSYELAQGHLQDIAVCILDIDFFKKVNDTYGHDNGDRILCWLADILKQNIDEFDKIVRWGGEEFLIFLMNSNEMEAYRTAEKIRKQVANSENEVCKITVSAGISIYNGGDYRNTVKQADLALYEAKRIGRNKVVKYSALNSSIKGKYSQVEIPK